MIPLVPPKEFIEQQQLSNEKKSYIYKDTQRIFSAYGLNAIFPQPFDINWAIPHAAFLASQEQGHDLEFARDLSLKRFCEGQDISSESVLRETANNLGIDEQKMLNPHQHRPYQKQLLLARRRMQEDGVFGVPTFVYQKQLFWGNDRLEWLLRRVKSDLGEPVSDLTNNPLLHVFST